MNFSAVRYICAMVLIFESIFMFLALIVSLIYGETQTALSFATTIFLMISVCSALGIRKPKDNSFYAKEGIITVSFSWLLLAFFGAVSNLISGQYISFVDCIFESISGFTTTGSTILTSIEVLDRGTLFWRSFTNWIGGMGVLMFITAFLPMPGADPLYIMKAESPGPTMEKFVPKAKQTAKIIYTIYLCMSVILVLFLLAGKMPLYDAIVTMFSTAGTGGFSIKSASIYAYDSLYIEVVLTVFMLLFGVNFSAYFLLLAKEYKKFLTFEEVRVYFIIVAVAMGLITLNITHANYETYTESFRHASFTVASIITTTGFTTANFDLWPTFSKSIIFFLMFIGACAGSTCGGIKVSRFIILGKNLHRDFERILHPQVVSLVKLDKKPVQEAVIDATSTFVVAYILVTAFSVLLVSIDGFDAETTVSAVASAINNVGPGFGVVAPIGTFEHFSTLSKVVLSFDMLVGRLEVFPILLLFMPSMWKKRKTFKNKSVKKYKSYE